MLQNLKTLRERIAATSRRLLKQYTLWFCAASILIAIFIPLLAFNSFINSAKGNGDNIRILNFSTGYTIKKISDDLESSGIISNSLLFSLYARLEGNDHKVKAGTYRFSNAMPPAEILQKLITGDVYEVRFTIPEGYSIYQIAELLDKRGIFKKESFLQQCFNVSLLTQLGIQSRSVEGFLFPSTYAIPPDMNEAAFIRAMVSRFRLVYDRKYAERAQALGLSQLSVLTIASMVEKEAIHPLERSIISSVFQNRLKMKMPLQSDPTAVYGIRAFAGKVSKKDIARQTPYNTYMIKGLPPGPIGNPGEASIEAALFPARTQYLYFVSKMDGTHQFSANLKDHNEAVRKYLKTTELRHDSSMNSTHGNTDIKSTNTNSR